MMYWLSKLFFRLSGWSFKGGVSHSKAVVIAAPHTSNWDLVYARAAFYLMNVPVRFTIKKEWMKGPLGPLLRILGGIGIDRNKTGKMKRSMVEAMIDLFDEHEELIIMVTPEGTRSYAPKWKTGFYFVAQGAGVPIYLGYLDYANKEAGIGPYIIPTGEVDEQIEEIKDFYRTKKGKFPEKGIL
ncbi:MAG: 1-acyl-sn-glycerol-3-phosphate acyltransferase [Candidatus Cyclobacteriaceae bacterium M2_1C_046]